VAGAAGIRVMKTVSRTNNPDVTVSVACQNIHTYIHIHIYIYIIVNFVVIIMVVMGTSKDTTSKPSLDLTLSLPPTLRLSYIHNNYRNDMRRNGVETARFVREVGQLEYVGYRTGVMMITRVIFTILYVHHIRSEGVPS